MTSPDIFVFVARIVAVFSIVCAANVRSSDDRDTTNVLFTLWSGRNATGHRNVKVVINIPAPDHTKTKSPNDVRLDVQQKTHFMENRKFIQLAAAFVAVEDATSIPPENYELVQGLGWYRLHVTPLTWEEARLACEAEGAHLAVLNSPREAAALKRISDKGPPSIAEETFKSHLFVGFSDKTEGKYVTIFGETLESAGYAVWDSGRPSNAKYHHTDPDSDCGGVHRSHFKLLDLPCGAMLAYFCEFKL